MEREHVWVVKNSNLISWVCQIQARDVGSRFPHCSRALPTLAYEMLRVSQASPPEAISLCRYAEVLSGLGTQTWISHILSDFSNVQAIECLTICLKKYYFLCIL